MGQGTAVDSIERIGGASLIFVQQLWRDSVLLADGCIKVACVDVRSLAPAPLPAVLTSALRHAGAAA